MKEWYQISAEEVKKKMETSEHGLTTEEAAKRLAQYGENVLAEGKKKSVFAVFFGQFADLLVGILIVAAGSLMQPQFPLVRGIRRAPLSFWL